MPQTVKQAQAALGALLDALQAQQELQARRGGVGAGGSQGPAQDLDAVISSTAEDLLQLGAPPLYSQGVGRSTSRGPML